MPLKAGKEGDLVNSMAKEIENAFRANWRSFMTDDMAEPDTSHPHLRLLFVSIAQGVIKHLKDNAGNSFIITESDGDEVANRRIKVETET